MAYPVKKLVLHARPGEVSQPDFTWNDYDVWVDGKLVAAVEYETTQNDGKSFTVWIVRTSGLIARCNEDDIEQTVRGLLAELGEDFDFPAVLPDYPHPLLEIEFAKHFPELVPAKK